MKSSRERILEEATRLFEEQGYEKTTVDEIGVAAGVTGPAIYRHFKSKGDLLVGVIDKTGEPFRSATRSLMDDPSLEPLQALRSMVAVWVDSSFRYPRLLLEYTHEHPRLDDATREVARLRNRMWAEKWIEVVARLRPDIPPAELLVIYQGAGWLIQSHAFYRSALPREHLASRLRTMVLGALLAEDDPGPWAFDDDQSLYNSRHGRHSPSGQSRAGKASSRGRSSHA